MDLILVEDVPNLGGIGDQVSVKDGYGRNYLLPEKLAIVASVKNARRLEHEKRLVSFRLQKAKAEAQAYAGKLANTSITIARKVGEQDKLFGSVTTHDIAAALADEGIQVDRRKLHLEEPIRTLGVYQVPLKLRGDVTAEVKVWVVAE
ncbi:MAG: 50S ribosomal protein L9 [Myxococcota bacterium]